MNVDFRLLKVGHCHHPECVAQRGGRWRSALFPALCGLLRHPDRGWILFDTGYSSHFTDATEPFPERLYRWVTPFTLAPEEALLAQLAALGIGAGDIACVIISHMHGDHIAGLRDFPNARFVTLRAEHESLRARSRLAGLMHGVLPALLPPDFERRVVFADELARVDLPAECLPFDSGFDLFGDGSVIGVPLPGHSRGQMGIVFRQADDRLAFLLADACWSRAALRHNQPPTWLAGRIFDSASRYARTFDSLRALSAKPDAPLLLPSHCESSWKEWNDASD